MQSAKKFQKMHPYGLLVSENKHEICSKIWADFLLRMWTFLRQTSNSKVNPCVFSNTGNLPACIYCRESLEALEYKDNS